MRDSAIVVRFTTEERAAIRAYRERAAKKSGAPVSESSAIRALTLVGLKEKGRER